jgi:hypothetical protein
VLLVFVDRERRADEYPWLPWKVRLFIIGAVLALGGMAMRMDWLVLVAIGILVLGFMIRFLPGGKGVVHDDDDDEEEEGSR